MATVSDLCPAYASFFGYCGGSMAMMLSSIGAAYGTSKSGVAIAGIGPFRPDLIMKSLIPVVMAGIIAIYGLVISVLITSAMDPSSGYSVLSGMVHMAAGSAVGWAGIAAGWSIGIVGDASVRGLIQQPRLFVGMVLVLIFAEVLGLYGLIVALILTTRANNDDC